MLISLYIHIPFCVSKCHYCDFYSRRYDHEEARRLIDALSAEWQRIKHQAALDGAVIHTIYIGGGTPSLLPPELWERLHRGLTSRLAAAPDVEWTVECNPDSFTEEKARLWRSMGVTRLTLGVQSLDDRLLSLMGRRHTAAQALRTLASPALAAFRSVGADLIYGLPWQTSRSAAAAVKSVLDSGATSHLSAYELTLHEGTALFRHRRALPIPGEESVVATVQAIGEACAAGGLPRYEISNYARPGHECRHNRAYWSHEPYVGLGPAAHSYLPPTRYANVSDTRAYIDAVGAGRDTREFSETIDSAALAREMIFLGLRCVTGIDEEAFGSRTGRPLASDGREQVLRDLLDADLMRHEAPRWTLTRKGMLLADAIAAKLMNAGV